MRTALPCALGQCQRDIGGVPLPIKWQVHTTCDALDVEMVVAVFDFVRRDFFDLDTKGPRHCRLSVQFFQTCRCERRSDRPNPLESGGNTGFRFKLAIEFLAVFGQFGHICRSAQLRNQARGVPSGARSQLLAFQKDNVLPAQFGQVIGNRAPHNAATDDDNTGSGRQIRHITYPQTIW